SLYHAKHLQLSFHAESIAALDFYSSCSQSDEILQTFPCSCEEIVFRSIIQSSSRIQDPSAMPGNLGITHPLQFLYKFFLTTRRKHEMCVRIAPCRQYHSPRSIDVIGKRGWFLRAILHFAAS